MRTQLRSSENIIFSTSKHWYPVVKDFILLVLAVIPIGIYYFFPNERPVFKYDEYTGHIVWGILLLGAVNFLRSIKAIILDIFVITNERVIFETGFWTRNIRENPTGKIGNTNLSITVIGRLLNFGHLSFQTASDAYMTEYRYVKSAVSFRNALSNTREHEGEEHRRIECPHCAELIRMKANICPFCRNEISRD